MKVSKVWFLLLSLTLSWEQILNADVVINDDSLYVSERVLLQKIQVGDSEVLTSTTILDLGGSVAERPRHPTQWGGNKKVGYAFYQFELAASYGPTFYLTVFDRNKPRGDFHVAFDEVDLNRHPEVQLKAEPLDIVLSRARDNRSALPVLCGAALSEQGVFSLICISDGVLSWWAVPVRLPGASSPPSFGGRPLDQYRPWLRIGSVRLSDIPKTVKCLYLGERLLIAVDKEVWEIQRTSDTSIADPLITLRSRLGSPVQRGREMSSEEFYGPDSLRLEPVGTLKGHPREVLVDHNQNMIFFEAPDGEWEHIRLLNGKPTIGKPELHALPERAIAILNERRMRQ